MILYNLFLILYRFGIGLAAGFNPKAQQWISGRKDWRSQMSKTSKDTRKAIWIHCSSLGEFEQGRPLLEQLKEQYPEHKIVLTFFSPSGFEACKNYSKADYIFYLPIDYPRNAKDFIDIVNPALAVFIKYEFWHYYLANLYARKIPVLLVAAAFRPEQAFFKWYGSFFRRMLRCFTSIHVQDQQSANLLDAIGINTVVTISGDTRYDRVHAIANSIKPIEIAATFKGDYKILIAGSTWPTDESILQQCLSTLPANWKLIIAPHEVDSKHISEVATMFQGQSVLYSALLAGSTNYNKKVLIIDNIGILSSLYAYGEIAWVGGGFLKGGIHNTLEPAIFGLPIIMGPVYTKFVEAVQLVAADIAYPIANAEDARSLLQKLTADAGLRKSIHSKLQQFMQEHMGATAKIITQISEAGWITKPD